jgi:hypothetical protein
VRRCRSRSHEVRVARLGCGVAENGVGVRCSGAIRSSLPSCSQQLHRDAIRVESPGAPADRLAGAKRAPGSIRTSSTRIRRWDAPTCVSDGQPESTRIRNARVADARGGRSSEQNWHPWHLASAGL